MDKKNKYYVGTELKIAIAIQCEGFDMDVDDWTCTVKKGSKSVVCDKTHNTAHDTDGWYLLVDSSKLGSGIYDLIVDIDVPDADYEDALRHETYKQELFTVNAV